MVEVHIVAPQRPPSLLDQIPLRLPLFLLCLLFLLLLKKVSDDAPLVIWTVSSTVSAALTPAFLVALTPGPFNFHKCFEAGCLKQLGVVAV